MGPELAIIGVYLTISDNRAKRRGRFLQAVTGATSHKAPPVSVLLPLISHGVQDNEQIQAIATKPSRHALHKTYAVHNHLCEVGCRCFVRELIIVPDVSSHSGNRVQIF